MTDGAELPPDRLAAWERSEQERFAASGRHGRKGHRCAECRGSGQVPGVVKQRGTGMGSTFGTCPECDGLGYIDETPLHES